MKKIKIGILGATRGMDYALHALKNNPHAEVTALCEKYQALAEHVKAETQKTELKLNFYSDFEKMLSTDIDAVIICNFANCHAPYAIRALNAGKHVLSEVQPVQNMAEAAALCDAVEKSGKIYSYAENYCYRNENFEMRMRYEHGDIGELVCAEGDFINDCSFKWHLLTRGDRNHWRNFVPSTFYCTHSIGPMLFISGLRPKSVVGMEIPLLPYMKKHGARSGSAAMEIIQLENGAVCKSLHGNLKRPFLSRCRMTGTKGTMENDISEQNRLRVFIEGEKETVFNTDNYIPSVLKMDNGKTLNTSIGNGISYAAEFFIGAILGDETALRYTINVYQAMDMSLPGLLAYRSILDGNMPYTIPDFRDPEQRQKYIEDISCTDPNIASGKALLPSCSTCNDPVPEKIYAAEAEKYEDSFKNSFKLGSN